MAAEIDSMPSPPRLPSDREAMTTCQVDVRTLEEASGVQQMMGVGELPQASIGAAEVSIKMLMSSKVSVAWLLGWLLGFSPSFSMDRICR